MAVTKQTVGGTSTDGPAKTEGTTPDPAQTDGNTTLTDTRPKTDGNPTVTPGDRLGSLGTLSGNTRPADGTGFHCGICGKEVGQEGQHYNEFDEVVETPHANTLVVADDWTVKQDEQDAETVKQSEEARARKESRDAV